MKSLATLLFFCLAGLPRLAAGDPVVVELFTSQGCNSCPPAERLLHDLADREELIPLEFHVDYWDRLGWPDPFGLAAATARQRAYGSWFSLGYVYTPQMVIDGAMEMVGSRRSQVLAAIAEAREREKSVTVEILEDGAARLSGPALGAPATLWLVAVDAEHATEVARGENAGKRLVNTNVVRSIDALGAYEGGELQVDLPLAGLAEAGRSHAVLLVQAEGDGPILGAGRRALVKGD